jgi:hypothetical protein
MAFRLFVAAFVLTVACGAPEEIEEVATAQSAGLKNYTGCRSEVPHNVKAIKTAEIIYDAENDEYLAISAHPSAYPSGATAVVWGENKGFKNLNWSPNGKVRGVYSVSATARDFEVKGRIDCDEDGVEAVYTATKSINPTMLTSNEVY